MICDLGLARTLAESSVGKGSIDSKRIRTSINSLTTKNQDFDEDKIKKIVAQKIKQNYNERTSHKRSISNHVGSRWYRAPEIQLMESHYDTASDLWSLGCCFYELARITEKPKNESKTTILFPGKSSYPLSPDTSIPKEEMLKTEQLNMILQTLGPLDDASLGFILDNNAVTYVKKLQE